MKELSHMDEQGRPKMVDVSGKPETERIAIAKGLVKMQAATFERIKGDRVEKGDVLAVAQLAGISAAKQTSHLIPLCHPIPIDEVKIDLIKTMPSKSPPPSRAQGGRGWRWRR
jgi:cyclic pyranopterin phosphate synthase